MNTSKSDIYVAKLLQQLEELKRKKAHSLQKWKKFKKTSSKQGNVVKDISCHSIENISRHISVSGEKSNDGSKCSKCGLCLISKESPCIQCLSAEYKENKLQSNSKTTNVALKIEHCNSEKQITSCPKVFENSNDSKSAFRNKETEKSVCSNVIQDVQNGQFPCCVLEPVQNNIISNENDIFTSGNSELTRKHRKRSINSENDLEQGEQYDHKKLKLSREALQRANIPNNSLKEIVDTSSVICAISSADKPNESEEKSKPQSKVTDTLDGIDDSLLHNMSCFLSPSPVVEDENNIKTDSTEQINSRSHTGLEIDQKQNVVVLKPAGNDIRYMDNLFFSKNIKDTLVSKSLNNVYSEKVKLNNFEMIKRVQQLEVVSKKENDLQATAESNPLNDDTVKKNEAISVSCTKSSIQNLESVKLKDSGQEHTLNCKLFSEPDVHCDGPSENSSSVLKNNGDFTGVCENSSNCLSRTSDLNVKDHKVEADEDVSESLSSNSQLIKDLKVADFSSFENSNSIEKMHLVDGTEPGTIDDNQTPSLLDLSNTVNININHNNGMLSANSLDCKTEVTSPVKQKEVDENQTSSLQAINVKVQCENGSALGKKSLNGIPAIQCDNVPLEIAESENLFYADDALTADIDFNSTSLEVADTLDDLLTKSSKEHNILKCDKPLMVSNYNTLISVLELNAPDVEIFTIPETELLEPSYCTKSEIEFNKSKDYALEECKKESLVECSEYQVPVRQIVRSKRVQEPPCVVNKENTILNTQNAIVTCDILEETQCDSLDQLQTIQDTVFLDAEDSLALGNYKNIPFIEKNEIKKTSSSDLEELAEDQGTIMKFFCCLPSDIDEPVNDVKLVTFNSSSYAFVQHVTWIQVWRQDESEDWIKIFSHQVDDKLRLKEICFTKDDKHLVLIMLLCGDPMHCLQFLLFEKEARVIKLMEHTHWMQNRCSEDTVLLCGLGDLKFATAQGKDSFEVFVHIFSSLENSPKLAMVPLGSTAGFLHSLCRIEKLPNALMGTSHSTLYVWHLLEGRLVTSVSLQLPDLLTIEKCIWATIESGLVFFMTVCGGEDGYRSCQLLATNLATGFCQTAMSYSFMPSKEMQSINNRQMKAVYCEPFLAASCEDGCFLWSATEECCCASLNSKADVTAVNICSDREGELLVAVGNASGCVNCYSLKCS